MREKSKISTVFVLFATMFSSLAIGNGYDNLVRHDISAPANLAPFASAGTSDGGLWLLAQGTIDKHRLVRLDANGNRTASVFLPTAIIPSNADQFSVYPLPDGGVLELNSNLINRRCTLRRITREGVLRFEHEKSLFEVCSLRLKSSGLAPYLLISNDESVLLDEDGAVISNLDSGVAEFFPSGVAEFFPGSNELLFLSVSNLRTGYVLTRDRDDGSTRWSIPLSNTRFDQNITVRGLNDGRALLLIADAGRLQLQIYSTTGDFISASEIVMPESSKANFGDWTQDSQGNHAVALSFGASGSTRYGAALFTADGSLLKQVRYLATDQCTKNCPLLGLAQGFATALRTQTGGKLVQIPLPANAPITELEFAGAFHAKIALVRNGTILMTSDSSLRAFNQNGTEIGAPSVLGKGLTQPKILAGTVADDGKSFVVHESNDGQARTQLEAFAGDGTRLWQRSVGNLNRAELIANRARVCFVGYNNPAGPLMSTLACFDSASGTELNTITLPILFPSRIRFLENGGLRMAFPTPVSLNIVDISNDNLINQFNVPISNVFSIADISDTGEMLVNRPGEWLYLRTTGEVAFSRVLTGALYVGGTVGRVLQTAAKILIVEPKRNSTSGFDVVLLYPDGSPRWSKTIDTRPVEVLIDGTYIYLIPETGGPERILALAIHDGHTAWEQEVGLFNSSYKAKLHASANANELLLSIGYSLGTQLTRLETATGAILEQRMLGCNSANCIQVAGTVDRSGEFRTIVHAHDPTQAGVAVGRSLASIRPEIALDQIGLSGAWYTPAITGQGLFLEYFPQNKLLFAPWFTYSHGNSETSGGSPSSNSVSNLRWYTVSGTVEAGATSARLEIRRNIGGKFATAPITTSSVVGSAILRATDCNHASLTFTFNTSEAFPKAGVLPLDRLTGGSAPCQLSNGQTLPGRDARSARNGFDGRQSGSWYQPTTAGQGLMMTVQPATASAPGFFFGGWFTYDAGTPNDPTTQHWLTLSGEISVNAQSGVVPVTIYRTLGGQLAAVPTQNNTILGRGTVTFSGCSAAVLRFQFDDALIVGAFKARAGAINLSRLGACPAQ